MKTGTEWCPHCFTEVLYVADNETDLIKCPFCGTIMRQCYDCTDMNCPACSTQEHSNSQEISQAFGFADDSEKMFDFLTLSKDEFLQTYSYLTEQEYYTTATQVMSVLKNYFETI